MSKRKKTGEQSTKSVEEENVELKNKIMKLQEEKMEMATKLLEKTVENCDLKLKMKEMETKIEKLEETVKGSKEKPVTDLRVHQNGYKLYFKNILTGRTFVINDCIYSDTVENLKAKVQDAVGTPVDQQTILFKGKQLDDRYTLGDSNIHRDAELDLAIRLRGC